MRWTPNPSLCFAILLIPGSAVAQTLEVTPPVSLVSDVLSIRASGLEPGQPAILRARMSDSSGIVWRSHAGFYADDAGVVDLSEMQPAGGDYSGISVMGLLQSMAPPAENRPWAQRPPLRRQVPFTVTFSLEVDGIMLEEATVERVFRVPGVIGSDVREEGLVGKLFVPERTPAPGIVLWGGSGGGLVDSEDQAALLASHGYVALALAYFGLEGLPEALDFSGAVELEYFERAVDWLASRQTVRGKGIAIMGHSRGTEPALWLASRRHPRISAVIATFPSSVMWCDWTHGGKSAGCHPWTPDPTYSPAEGHLTDWAVHFRHSLSNSVDENAMAEARIPVETASAPILLISGTADHIWPSFQMAQDIVKSVTGGGGASRLSNVVYEDWGHCLPLGYFPTASTHPFYCGSEEIAEEVQRELLGEILEFLKHTIGRTPEGRGADDTPP